MQSQQPAQEHGEPGDEHDVQAADGQQVGGAAVGEVILDAAHLGVAIAEDEGTEE